LPPTRSEGICANSARVGLLDKLRGLKDRHSPIGDVCGIGLMIGVENEDASHVRRYGLSSLRIARANTSDRVPMARDQQSSDPHSRAIATGNSVSP
jgi:4-aminobutyrate aminotransferase-like enzyme